jgi:hypothetical protein
MTRNSVSKLASPSASAKTPKSSKKNRKKEKTPPTPEANGVYGFMFTSPGRGKKLETGVDQQQNLLGAYYPKSPTKRQLAKQFNEASNNGGISLPASKAVGGLVTSGHPDTNSLLNYAQVQHPIQYEQQSQTEKKKKNNKSSSSLSSNSSLGSPAQSQNELNNCQVLFSPYNLRPVKHNYGTRAKVKFERMQMDIDSGSQYIHMEVSKTIRMSELDTSDLDTVEVAEVYVFFVLTVKISLYPRIEPKHFQFQRNCSTS